VVDKIPVKFNYDGTTPSALGEFTSEDTVSIVNGGTGVSSLANFGTSLSATTVLASIVSATAVSGVTMDCGGLTAATASISWVSSTILISPTITGTSVSSTTLTSPAITVASVSATAVSATTITVDGLHTALPIPAPWAYVRMTTAGTPNDAEQNIGIGATATALESSEDHFTWDDTNKRFNVSATGTYEFTVNAVLMVDATTTITLKLYNTYPGSAPLTADTRVHSSIDADIVTLTFVGAFTGGSYAFVTTTDDGATDVTIQAGTSMLIKRLN